MNLIDGAILGIWALFVVAGVYKGFLRSAIGLGAFVLSLLLAWLLYPLAAGAFLQQGKMFSQLLYYAEASDMLGSVELAKQTVNSLPAEQAEQLIYGLALPVPLGRLLIENIENLAFASYDIYTLGEYIDHTSVHMSINLLCMTGIFAALLFILEFSAHMLDQLLHFPQLRQMDGILGGLLGVLKGGLVMYVFFTLIAVVLSFVSVDFLIQMLSESGLAAFFYRSNLLLQWIPGVI